MRNDIHNKLSSIVTEVQYKCISELNGAINVLEDSLYTGGWGMVLFLAYYNKMFKNKDKEILDRYIDFRLERLCNIYPKTFSFCDGMAGVMYLLHFIKEKGLVNVEIDDFEKCFDKYFRIALDFSKKECGYDFLHGTLGIGLYYLKRQDSVAKLYIKEIIDYLRDTAMCTNQYIYWQFLTKSNELVPNISLSHGIASIIIFLVRVMEKELYLKDVTLLLRLALPFLQSQEMDRNIHGCYFPVLSKQVTSEFSRLAWCYGDLGVATALYKAGVILQDDILVNKSLEIFEFSAGRKSLRANLLNEGGICHGTAGVAQIFKRMYLNTGNDLFLATSLYWIRQTLRLGQRKNGLCGYDYFDVSGWKTSYDFLVGISGIGLVLLSSLEKNNLELSAWDELLLLS